MPETHTTVPRLTLLGDIPPKIAEEILLLVEIEDIFNIRQTCTRLVPPTKTHSLWIKVAQRLIKERDLVWPSWALPLTAIPASTLEDLVVRATRLSSLVNRHDWKIDTRKTFEGVIQRPWDSPMWLHLVRGRWLLVQLSDFTLELWDLDEAEITHPAATYVGLEGLVNGVVLVERTNGVEITLNPILPPRSVRNSATKFEVRLISDPKTVSKFREQVLQSSESD
ncbi:hypothetical protein M407DRAFT_18386 [Tulasnella calospora MUT 4182]|uniref:F-box domain-containing protein n=1 Tax=Tulasnella calospora MUT 4182 TaxID=1051891 RepID=A0A0C3QJS9_9AGAM|nr:hypothetical protein M407DRAFT_18386 [Tulasnella calospora MUT 4182]